MSRKVRAERSVVGKYEQHKCEYSWRICTIVQHSEGPGPLTASIQIAYFRRFWSKWSQWHLKIHSYFLITESTSKTESKIIFCMIAQGSHVLPNRFPGGQHCLFLAVSWSSQKIWALAGRSDSVEERACSCENDFVRLNLLVILARPGSHHQSPSRSGKISGCLWRCSCRFKLSPFQDDSCACDV